MSPHLLLALGILATWSGSAAAQSSALDLIPASAAGAIVIRHPEELRRKGDDFLKEVDFDPGLRPTDALDMLMRFLGVNNGMDLARPAAAVYLRPENERKAIGLDDFMHNVYVALAYADLDKMGENFGFARGELKLDTIAPVKGGNQQFTKYILARDRHVYIGMAETPLQRLRQAKPARDDLTADQRRTFAAADMLVHVNPTAFGQDWTGFVKMMENDLGKITDPHEQHSMGAFVQALASMRFAMAGIRLDEGLGINFLTAFPTQGNDAVKEFLASLRAPRSAALRALPAGRVFAAHAFAGDGARNAVLAQAVFKFLLRDILETKQITSAQDRPTFAGVFSEVWQRLQGSRMAAYLTRDEARLGLCSVVAILDTEDPVKFVSAMRTLAKIADGTLDLAKKAEAQEIDIGQLLKDLSADKYATRASATTRLRLAGETALPHLEKAAAMPPDLETSRRVQLLIREISAVAAERRKELLATDLPRYVRPAFAFIAKAETRAGLPIDIVHMKLAAKVQAGQMQQYFGPDWDKLRLAVYGKHVVVLLGSEVELLETTIANLKEGKAGLADSKSTQGFARLQAPNVTSALHFSLETLLGLVSGQPRRAEPPRLTSLGLSVQDAALQFDLHVPVGDIRVGARR